jgi:threonyl-tRNA synthetase
MTAGQLRERPVSGRALVVLGCPEVPVQQALSLHAFFHLKNQGFTVHATGNPAVLNLIRVSDPERRYLPEVSVLETCIGEIVEKKRVFEICLVFAHSDAGISYAATMRHILPDAYLVLVLFGKDPMPLERLVDFPCEMIVEKAVHNPVQLARKINGVFGWVA